MPLARLFDLDYVWLKIEHLALKHFKRLQVPEKYIEHAESCRCRFKAGQALQQPASVGYLYYPERAGYSALAAAEFHGSEQSALFVHKPTAARVKSRMHPAACDLFDLFSSELSGSYYLLREPVVYKACLPIKEPVFAVSKRPGLGVEVREFAESYALPADSQFRVEFLKRNLAGYDTDGSCYCAVFCENSVAPTCYVVAARSCSVSERKDNGFGVPFLRCTSDFHISSEAAADPPPESTRITTPLTLLSANTRSSILR